MKNLLLILLGVLCMSGSANAGNANTAFVELASSRLSSSAPTGPLDSKRFLSNAYQDGLAEIRLAEIAVKQATNIEVRFYAQGMIEDHSKTNNEIVQMAKLKNFALPSDITPEQKALLSKLSGLSATDTERLYMSLNIDMHEKDLEAFKDQAARGTDSEIRLLAAKVVPIMEVHLQLAERINSKLDAAAFLAGAFRNGEAEILFSEMALRNASNSRVKAYARHMIDDHTRASQAIMRLATQKSLNLPDKISAAQQGVLEQLSQLSGPNFDKAYMEVNLIIHAVAVELFLDQASEGRDPEIQKFAENTLPALIAHFHLAAKINANLNPDFLYEAYRDGNAEIVLSYPALHESSMGITQREQQLAPLHSSSL